MLKYIVALMALFSLTFAEEGRRQHRQFDVDCDNALNKTEWIARASARFDKFDANKDGVVTPEEAKIGRANCKGNREERKNKRN